MVTEKYIIVKHAGDHWRFYFSEDPKLGGLDVSWSAHDTYTGHITDMKPYYTDKDQADHQCQLANVANPVGSYGVCRVAEECVPLPD